MSRSRLSRRWLPAAAGLGLGLAALLESSAGAQSSWSLVPLEGVRRTGTFGEPPLVENSGVIPSRTQPGILWSVADSDGPPRIYATDTLGEDRGSLRLRGARNVDWEAISAGSCGAGHCLYVADTGDNREQRQSVQLYRIREPRVESLGGEHGTSSRVERLEVRYPDGPHDVEAAFVDGRGDVHLISKGRTSGVRHYRVPAAAWRSPAVVAQPLGVLPIEESRGLGSLVTDAAVSPSGGLVAVRTYGEIFLFHLTGRGTLRPAWVGCGLGGLELQGEGVAWLDDSTLVLTSEGFLGFPGTITLGRCPSS